MEYMAQDRISFVASTKRDETPFFQSSYVVRMYDTRPFRDSFQTQLLPTIDSLKAPCLRLPPFPNSASTSTSLAS